MSFTWEHWHHQPERVKEGHYIPLYKIGQQHVHFKKFSSSSETSGVIPGKPESLRKSLLGHSDQSECSEHSIQTLHTDLIKLQEKSQHKKTPNFLNGLLLPQAELHLK